MKNFYKFWGKAIKNQEIYHLLVYHMIDVGAVVETYLNCHQKQLHLFNKWCGLTSIKETKKFIVLLAILHDLGKFAICFQHKREDLLLKLKPKFKNFSIKEIEEYEILEAYHTNITFMLLRYIFEETDLIRIFYNRKKAKKPVIFNDLLESCIQASAGHHGTPVFIQSSLDISPYISPILPTVKKFIQSILDLLKIKEFHFSDNQNKPQELLNDVSHFIAGAIILGDWVGSNNTYFPLRSEIIPLPNYRYIALQQAKVALRECGLYKAKVNKTYLSFTDLFKNYIPTNMQRIANNIEIPKNPSLFILEDMTSRGKTESVLTIAQHILSRGYADSIYFALPTMATTDAMAKRLEKICPKLYNKYEFGVLHSQKSVYNYKIQKFNDECIKFKQKEVSDVNLWATASNKQAIMSHVSCGTIDQSLLSILHSKHYTLRLFGLTNNIFIVDEVDACEEYAFSLLLNLVKELSKVNCYIIILSATLTLEQKNRLIQSYEEGRHND